MRTRSRSFRPRVSTVVAAVVFVAASIVYLSTDQTRGDGTTSPTPTTTSVALPDHPH